MKKDQPIGMVQERPALYDITEKLYANKGVRTAIRKQQSCDIESKRVIAGFLYNSQSPAQKAVSLQSCLAQISAQRHLFISHRTQLFHNVMKYA